MGSQCGLRQPNIELSDKVKKMTERAKADFDAFAEEYSFLAWTIASRDSRGYDEVMSFLPTCTNRVLDVGCGSGVLSLRLADHVDYMVGVDISSSMIRLARLHQARLKKRNVEFVVADIENLPFGEATFDFVVSNSALHHSVIGVSLPGLSRLVKPGGRMVICDLLISNPSLGTSPVWQILRAIRKAPGYAMAFGFRAMWRIVSFQMKPAWIRHVCDDKHKKLTPESFREIYGRFLPGCRFERNPKTPWRMIAFWEAPGS